MELQLRSDPLFLSFHSQADGVQYQVDSLMCFCLVSHDAVFIEIPDHGQVQYSLLCMDVRDVCYPFAVRSVCAKISVQNVFILVDLLPHLLPFPAAADLRQQAMFLHDPQYSFGVAENVLCFQPQPPVAISAEAALSLPRDELCKSSVLLWSTQAMDKVVVASSGYFKKTHTSRILDILLCGNI